MSKTHPRAVILLLALAISGGWCLTGSPAQACPMCSESLPDGSTEPAGTDGQSGGLEANAGGSLAKGFYYSILFMLAMPFALVAGLGSMLYWATRKTPKGVYPPPIHLPRPPSGG